MAKDSNPSVMSRFHSDSSPSFAQGGPKDGMASRTGVVTAECGGTHTNASGKGGDWAKGGSGPMHSRTPAQKRTPGGTGGMP